MLLYLLVSVFRDVVLCLYHIGIKFQPCFSVISLSGHSAIMSNVDVAVL